MTFNAKHEPVENPRAAGASGSWPPASKRFPSTARQRGLATQAVQDRFSFEEVGADNCGPKTTVPEVMHRTACYVKRESSLPPQKRCSKCGLIKPLAAFYVNTASRDGHRPDCKACLSRSQNLTHWLRGHPGKTADDYVSLSACRETAKQLHKKGLKTCKKCHRTQPIAAFAKDRSRRDGLHPWCRTCNVAKERRRSARHRAGHRVVVKSKRCPRCGQTKMADEFYRCVSARDGLTPSCKVCANLRTEQRRNKRRAEGRPYTGNPHTVFRRFLRLHATARSLRLKKKYACLAVFWATRSGRLVYPEACEQCGKTTTLHKHHDDYDHPLAVRVLCAKCHFSCHRLHHYAESPDA